LLQLAQRMQRQSMARALGSEKEQLVQTGCISLRGTLGHDGCHALEHGENRGQGLADAGRGLSHQAATACAGMGRAIDGHGQLPLPGSEGRHGKFQLRHGLIARLTVGGLAACPVEIAGTLRFEKGLQFGGRTLLHQHGLLCAADLEINQRQLDPLKAALLTQQMTVDPGLGPVQAR
jgi:hypothetical protein